METINLRKIFQTLTLETINLKKILQTLTLVFAAVFTAAIGLDVVKPAIREQEIS
jgi:hypothetical protein